MRTHLKKTTASKKSCRRLPLTTVIVAMAILAIGAVTVASRQKLPSDRAAGAQAAPAGEHVQLNSVQSETPSADDHRQIAEGLKPLIDQSMEGLSEVHHGDGSVSINLEDHFQNVTVARVNSNGTLAQSCVDNPKSAGAFFGFDPKLIENQPQSPVAPKRNADR